jgi:uncharacterized CHY-type Zn-finger protein
VDVNEDWWSNELKFNPIPLTASVKVKVKTETHTLAAPRLKIRPVTNLDDKSQLQKLLARKKKFGRVGKNCCNIKTESSPPSRIQPPRTKKFAGIKYENIVKCMDDVDEKVQKIRKNKNNALSPSKNNRSTLGKMKRNSYRRGHNRASKIKSGTSDRSYEVHKKSRKSCGHCPVCKKVYNYPAAMQNHVLIEHHLIPAVDQWRSLSCMKCRDSFTSRKSLIDHLFRFHYNTIVCTVCKKIFTSRKMMKNHFVARHILEQ